MNPYRTSLRYDDLSSRQAARAAIRQLAQSIMQLLNPSRDLVTTSMQLRAPIVAL